MRYGAPALAESGLAAGIGATAVVLGTVARCGGAERFAAAGRRTAACAVALTAVTARAHEDLLAAALTVKEAEGLPARVHGPLTEGWTATALGEIVRVSPRPGAVGCWSPTRLVIAGAPLLFSGAEHARAGRGASTGRRVKLTDQRTQTAAPESAAGGVWMVASRGGVQRGRGGVLRQNRADPSRR